MINNRIEYEKMHAVESHHWWYQNLHRLTLQAIRDELQMPLNASILDAGCGTGGQMVALRQAGYNNAEGFDLSADAVGFCQQHGLRVMPGDLRQIGHQFLGRQFDVIVSHDNLYFLTTDEQQEYFHAVAQLLKPGGALVMNAPVYRAFAGMHDVAVGIQERSSPSQLRTLSESAGLFVHQLHLWPMTLSSAILLVRLWQTLKLRWGSSQAVTSDVSLPPAWLNRILSGICRLDDVLYKRPWWGSSCFLVCTKIK
jgi:2-polyprenyl-3-methyl-5-hydroxy-6-metoxy-1,4-benzoquinol methylase